MKRTIPKLLTLVYIFETVKNTLLHGSAFWKNDIIDAMILGSMTPNDHLITCDKKMLEHMERYQKGHIEYANSLTVFCSTTARNVNVYSSFPDTGFTATISAKRCCPPQRNSMKKSCSRTIYDNCSHILQLRKQIDTPERRGERRYSGKNCRKFRLSLRRRQTMGRRTRN